MITMVPLGRMARFDEADRTLRANQPPDAVYANDELLGIALLEAARRRGLNVPDDLLVVTAADRQPTGAPIELTTLELDAAGTAAEAVDVLIDLIEGRPPTERMRFIPTRLVLGQSTNRRGT